MKGRRGEGRRLGGRGSFLSRCLTQGVARCKRGLVKVALNQGKGVAWVMYD